LKTIPIAKIVGSEGRYKDFDRQFLPKQTNTRNRWQRISFAHRRSIDLPAIQVYDLGGFYFIRDGNHRVSVARHRGIEYIDAEVTSIATEIKPDMAKNMDELKRAVIEYERDRFLKSLSLVDSPHNKDFRITTVGGYDDLVVHIGSHKRIMEERSGSPISHEEATKSWHELIYLPITKLIRDSGVLAVLPERTETDFYIWLIRHWDDVAALMSTKGLRRHRLRRLFRGAFVGDRIT
jgi:hypothetical protein